MHKGQGDRGAGEIMEHNANPLVPEGTGPQIKSEKGGVDGRVAEAGRGR